MNVVLQVAPHDPLVARDGRPFGVGQGNRMRGLPWPLASVVAGSFRTALVKSSAGLDFSGDIPQRLMQIAVAGLFPVHGGELYLPSPNDCAWDEKTNKVHRVQPIQLEDGEGVDFPNGGASLWPVRLTADQSREDFKAKAIPSWWPVSKLEEWLTSREIKYKPDWFSGNFFNGAFQSMRDHVAIDEQSGANKDGHIFASSNLNVTHLPRFYVKGSEEAKAAKTFTDRLAEITLSGRITIPDSETALTIGQQFGIWHPLGGERRMVHWQQEAAETTGWNCPAGIRSTLATATKVRMVLATPAVFKDGWKPGWLTKGLEGELSGVKLKLVGVSSGRWNAVSGWSLAPPRGPKPIRRMVPAGSVYFFSCEKGMASALANRWLQSVSDDEQEQRDGFGLATWGTW